MNSSDLQRLYQIGQLPFESGDRLIAVIDSLNDDFQHLLTQVTPASEDGLQPTGLGAIFERWCFAAGNLVGPQAIEDMHQILAVLKALVTKGQGHSIYRQSYQAEILRQPRARGRKANVWAVTFGELRRVTTGIPAQQKATPPVSLLVLPGGGLTVGTAQDGQ